MHPLGHASSTLHSTVASTDVYGSRYVTRSKASQLLWAPTVLARPTLCQRAAAISWSPVPPARGHLRYARASSVDLTGADGGQEPVSQIKLALGPARFQFSGRLRSLVPMPDLSESKV